MKLHPNAKTTPNGRQLLVRRVLEQDWAVQKVLRPLESAREQPTGGWRAIERMERPVCKIAARVRIDLHTRPRPRW